MGGGEKQNGLLHCTSETGREEVEGGEKGRGQGNSERGRGRGQGNVKGRGTSRAGGNGSQR